MKISHKLCVSMDGTQLLISWWFTAKNEGENDIFAQVYVKVGLNWKIKSVHTCAANTISTCTAAIIGASFVGAFFPAIGK